MGFSLLSHVTPPLPFAMTWPVLSMPKWCFSGKCLHIINRHGEESSLIKVLAVRLETATGPCPKVPGNSRSL